MFLGPTADHRATRLHVADRGIVFDPACHVSSWLGVPLPDTVLGARCP
jgi:hypothetical protein